MRDIHMVFKSALFIVITSIFSATANANIINLTFEIPAIAAGQYFLDGEYFTESSFQIGTTGVNGAVDILNPPASYTNGPNNGTAYLHSSTFSSVYLQATNNDIFSLLSLDLGEYSLSTNTASVTITGFKTGGDQISTIFQLDQIFDGLNNMADFQLVQFDSNWSNLMRVEFDSSAYSLDNIQLEMNAVPVPAAIWLFGSGFLCLVGFGKKKSRFSLSKCGLMA